MQSNTRERVTDAVRKYIGVGAKVDITEGPEGTYAVEATIRGQIIALFELVDGEPGALDRCNADELRTGLSEGVLALPATTGRLFQ